VLLVLIDVQNFKCKKAASGFTSGGFSLRVVLDANRLGDLSFLTGAILDLDEQRFHARRTIWVHARSKRGPRMKRAP
jgi:hypothetical protein